MRVVMLVVAIALLGLGAGAPAAGTEPGRITVGRIATVVGETVTVADLATLEGSATAFADVELGPAPSPGTGRRLDGHTILRRLKEAGLDVARTRYLIPATVRVERAAQDVGADELRAAVEDAAPELLRPGERLRSLDVPGPARIPLGAYDTRVAMAPAQGGGARRRFDVDVVQDGRVVTSVPVRAEIDAVGPVVVARRPLPRGTLLRADDLMVEDRDLTAARGGAIHDLADAVGKQTKVTVPAGAAVTFRAVERPILVQRGDLVTVVVETQGMRLSVPGEARETGAAGEAIRVLNRKSKQELSGRVVERGMVLVQY
jgi:flagellar basal body P-ring formation protein FlgA